MYKITIAELSNSTENTEKIRYEQTVESIDMKAVIDAVNRGSIVRRVRKQKQEPEAV